VEGEAHAAVASALAEGGFGPREVLVRVNARGTDWFGADLAALARAGADGIVLPEVESAGDVTAAVGHLEASGSPAGLPLWLTVETPRGVLAAGRT
jgi:citrate lyase subunit beta/citryl-CoA lyase